MATPSRLGRILIVEDDPAIASGVALLLEAEGIEVLLADSVAEGERLLEVTMPPDVLILDMALGDGSGADLYRHLLHSGRRVPAVFISAHADERFLDEFRSEPVMFLRKPFEFPTLWSALLEVLQAGGGGSRK